MLSHILLLFALIVGVASAQPSLAQVQQAVSKNPGLLNTPQAKAMMAENGVTAAEVTQKLADGKSSKVTDTSVSETVAENTIDTTEESDSKSDKSDDKLRKKENVLSKQVNPFVYKSNVETQKELNSKQQNTNFNKLKRYSMSFYANKNKLDSASLPTPDDYIMSVGDVINIHVYGDRNKNYSLSIKNDGTIDLAFIGPIKLGGLTYGEAKSFLTTQLKNHYRMSEFAIHIDKYSTIQVTLIGDVKFPGLYNLSSFSTVKDLLIVAKGVRKSASVRNIIVKRDSKVIAKLDFYDLLFKGNAFGRVLLKHGDIVIIKKADKLVSIDGYVNNAAIFELNPKETLRTLIEYAGGMKPDASKTEIKINRYDNNSKLVTFKVNYKESKNFKMKNGDKVYIYPLDFSAKNSINVYGNIIRPGTYTLNKKRSLNEFFKETLKSGMKKFFLPNTYFEYGVIKHYNSDLQYESKSFNLSDVINDKEFVKIAPNDQIYIFSMSDIYSNFYVTTKGSTLVKAGKLQFIPGMTIKDAVNASGIDGVLDDKIRVTTYATDDFMPKTTFYSLKNQGDTLLNAYDEIEVYDYYSSHILEPVSIKGEVVKPTSVYYEKDMSVADLLNIAGGFNKTAYTKSLSIVRYYVDKDQVRQQKVLSFDLSKTSLKSIKLKPYDEVKISKILGWGSQDYETVSISGEVHNPISVKYGKGITVEDLIIVAGGLTKRAYNRDIEIVRYSIDENETRERHIIKINTEHIALSSIVLKPYDEVTIFKIPNWGDKKVVEIRGQVKFPGKYTIKTGEKLDSVIERAGGFTNEAFISGAVFTRESVRKNQIDQYNKTLARLKRKLALFNAMPANAKNSASSGNATDTLNEVISESKKYQPIGRISVELNKNLNEFKDSQYNLTLKNKDMIVIPSQIDTVTVFGEVFNPTSFVYNDDLDVEDYINYASGFSKGADEDSVYVIHANGTSEPISSGWWIFRSYAEVEKGDTIVVPLYIKEYNQLDLWEGISKIITSFAITAATLQTIGVI
jgi:protein involved in polysaccharide export with SLBB domain